MPPFRGTGNPGANARASHWVGGRQVDRARVLALRAKGPVP